VKRKIKAGTTSFSLSVIVYDNTSTNGTGLSGITHTSSGLIFEYRRAGQSTWTSVTPVSKTLGTYTSGGIVANGARAGRYEIDIPDAAVAAGVRFVEVCLRGAANMHPVDIEIELDAVDYQVDAFGALKPTASGRTLDVTANGNAGIDLANVDNPTATLALTNTTISVGQQVASVSGNVVGSVGSVIGNMGGNVNGSVGSVAGSVAGNVTGSVGSVVGNVGGNVVGNVGSISGVTFPANFGNLGVQPTGEITRVGTVDELGSQALTANALDEAIAILVWSQLTTTTWPTNSFGKHVLISDDNNRSVKVVGAGAGHIAADIHELQPGVIVAGDFDATALAAIADATLGRATSTSTYDAGDVGYVLRQLFSMIESDGASGWELTAASLVNAPSGGGGASDWTANEKTAIRSILGFDASGNIISLSSGALFAISTQTQNLFKYGDTQVWTSPANQINVTVTKV
jgi:hypothetical protein